MTSNRWPAAPMPTADEVACAIVAACRHTGEDPISCASGSVRRVRARFLAVAVLRERHPRVYPKHLSGLVGFGSYDNTPLAPSRRPKYVDPGAIAAVRAAFAALLARHAAVNPAKACDRPPPAALPPKSAPFPAPVPKAVQRPRLEARDVVPLDRTVGKFVSDIAGKASLRDMLAQALANTPGARKV